MSLHRRLRWLPTLLLLGSAGFAHAPLVAQPAPEAVFGWLELGGTFAPTRYTPGSLDRADNVRRRMSLVIEVLARGGGRSFARPIVLYVAGPDEWGPAGAQRPYGLAEVDGPILMVPAWGNERTVALWTDLLGTRLDGDGSMPVRGTPEEAASLVPCDLLAQVEAARAGFNATGMKTTAPWVEDLLAHLVALAAFERNESGRMPQVDAFFELLIRRGQTDSNTPAPLDPNRLVSSITDTRQRLAAEGRIFGLARELSQGKAGKLVSRLIHAGQKYEGTIPAGEALKPEGALAAFARVYGASTP